ncbi:MAG: urea ABC transporter permease subunit UrtC [Pseudomonadota bacterium]
MKLLHDTHDKIFVLLLLVICSFPLLLHLGILHSTSTVLFIGKCISFCILVIGLDLIWGYTGILSLGHGLYFALGGYAMAMYLKLQATGGRITDFMFVGGLKELPLIWEPFQYGFCAAILIVLVPATVAGVIGYFIFRNRVKGVYFSIISQALTWAAYSIFIALSPYTNGNTGITEIKSIFGSIKGHANFDTMLLLFYGSTAILAIGYFVAKFIVRSKLGKVLVAIRDGENRTYFSGYKVSQYKNFVYILSAIFAGIGGAVFVNFNGSITPSQMTISYSIMMVIWVAIGGRGTILGAICGVFLVNLCEYNFSSGSMVEIWQYIVGFVFCITIIYFKGGIVGTLTEYLQQRKRLSTTNGK